MAKVNALHGGSNPCNYSLKFHADCIFCSIVLAQSVILLYIFVLVIIDNWKENLV